MNNQLINKTNSPQPTHTSSTNTGISEGTPSPHRSSLLSSNPTLNTLLQQRHANHIPLWDEKNPDHVILRYNLSLSGLYPLILRSPNCRKFIQLFLSIPSPFHDSKNLPSGKIVEHFKKILSSNNYDACKLALEELHKSLHASTVERFSHENVDFFYPYYQNNFYYTLIDELGKRLWDTLKNVKKPINLRMFLNAFQHEVHPKLKNSPLKVTFLCLLKDSRIIKHLPALIDNHLDALGPLTEIILPGIATLLFRIKSNPSINLTAEEKSFLAQTVPNWLITDIIQLCHMISTEEEIPPEIVKEVEERWDRLATEWEHNIPSVLSNYLIQNLLKLIEVPLSNSISSHTETHTFSRGSSLPMRELTPDLFNDGREKNDSSRATAPFQAEKLPPLLDTAYLNFQNDEQVLQYVIALSLLDLDKAAPPTGTKGKEEEEE